MKTVISILTFLVISNITSAQWSWQNPFPQGNDLFAVDFYDANTGWAVGELGTILRTTDGGTTWIQQISGITNGLKGVSFIDANNGWAVGGEIAAGDIILRTTNGGTDWIQQTSEPIFPGVVFTNEKKVTTIGETGTIFRTKNGGTDWTVKSNGTTFTHLSVSLTDLDSGAAVDLNGVSFSTYGKRYWILQTNGTENSIWGISFTDENNGMIVRGDVSIGGIIIRTNDGGQNWVEQANGPVLTSVSFADGNNGLAVGYNGTILKTTNGGIDWISQTSGTTASLFSISFIDGNYATAVGAGTSPGGAGQTIIRSTDGGTTWSAQSSGTSHSLWGVCFTDIDNGTAVGYEQIILRTTNGGLNWITQMTGSFGNLISVSFSDANNGTAAGSGGTILRTTDAGQNWISQPNGTITDLRGVSFTDLNNGTAAGDYGTVLRTTDGGQNWINQTSITSYLLMGVSFSDINNGTAVGEYGTIIRTTNGGQNWISQTSGTTAFLRGVSFTDINNGTVVGHLGKIIRTTNGGTTWFGQTSGTTINLYGVSFTDANNGTAVGEYGAILRTTDEGQNWISQTSGTMAFLRGVSFTDINNGTAVGSGGTILRTTDGGQNWISQTSGTTAYLQGVSFTDINNGTAVGSGGTILRTTDGGQNWVTQTSGIINGLTGVSFTDANNGTTVSDIGTILRTNNAGTTWELQPGVTINLLSGVFFTDVNTGWAVGEGGTIIKYSAGQASLFIWTNEILVQDAANKKGHKILTIGQHTDATDSIDLSLGEYELPPAPPTGAFDARFNLPATPMVSSLKDFRDSAKTEITWTMTFQPGSSGYPMTVSWDSTSFPEGTFYLRDRINGSLVNVNMKNQSSYTLTDTVIVSFNIIYNGVSSIVSVNNEWNMISVPLLAGDMALSNLFPSATSPAYCFDGNYVTEDTLVGGKGYWLKFDGDQQIQIFGARIGDTVPMETGWNMLGVYEDNIPISQITTTPPGIIATYFFGFNDGYYIADTLKTGQGYWARATADGTLNLNSGGLIKDGEQEFAKIDPKWGKIKITDSDDNSITLYAAEELNESNYLCELPPMPPTGVFDARFNSGNFVEDFRSEKTILISSDNYPVIIRAEGIDLTIREGINGEIISEDLKNGEEIRITNNKITSIKVSGRITGGSLISYELYQNYPNPFNPGTTIQFSIPEDVQNVKLIIYSALGEKIAELVNTGLQAGYYKYKWNTAGFASGIYVYQLVTDKFVSTKKMILLK